MIKTSKIVNNVVFNFDVVTEKVSNNNLVVNVKVAKHQEMQFSRIEVNSKILKSIALNTADSIKSSYKMKVNHYDSGTEWQGQFE